MIVKDVYAYSSLHSAEFVCTSTLKMNLSIFCLHFFFNIRWYEKHKTDKLKKVKR